MDFLQIFNVHSFDYVWHKISANCIFMWIRWIHFFFLYKIIAFKILYCEGLFFRPSIFQSATTQCCLPEPTKTRKHSRSIMVLSNTFAPIRRPSGACKGFFLPGAITPRENFLTAHVNFLPSRPQNRVGRCKVMRNTWGGKVRCRSAAKDHPYSRPWRPLRI